MYHAGGMSQIRSEMSVLPHAGLGTLIARHAHIEHEIDRAMERQDVLRKRYYRSGNADGASLPYTGAMAPNELQPGSIMLEDGTFRPRNDLRVSDLPRKDATSLMKEARSKVPAYMPNSSRRAVLNSCEISLHEIEAIEDDLVVYRMLMAEIEEQVLDFVPSSVQECVAKLTFLSGLMMDARSFDQHDIGYFLDEIAATLQGSAPALRD